MAKSKLCITLLMFGGLLLGTLSTAVAQRGITYEQLVRQQEDQNTFLDYFTIPGNEESMVTLVTTFRIDYGFLPFRRFDDPSGSYEFFSPAGMSIEVFRDENAGQQNRRRNSDSSMQGLEAVARSFWQDTAYAENYEQTQAGNQFLSGMLRVDLSPGDYSFMLQLNRGDETNRLSSQRSTVSIERYGDERQGDIILARDYTGDDGEEIHAELMNFGTNVYYGQDFVALAHLPGYEQEKTYSYQINRVELAGQDTTKIDMVFSGEAREDQLLRNMRPGVTTSASSEPVLTLEGVQGGEAYLLLEVPHSGFQNGVYLLEVFEEGREDPVSETIFRSRWVGMPVSLLNVNVAIDMLRYITDESTLNRLREGSNAQKEEKFRAFWANRDPTPETEFNELMAEYYRRIDYAYQEFTTLNMQGYNTDQGRIYIQYGPPDRVERRFPPGEPAVEVWSYPQRTFIFRAVSGFGQFELVSN